jgi:hypothetical protein
VESRPLCDQWKIDVNDRFQRLVDLLIGLSSAALVLPSLFLKEYLGIPQGNPVLIYLDRNAYMSVGAFLGTILLGITYHYTSTKWVKCAWGQKTYLGSRVLERILDWSVLGMAVLFISGLVFFLLFVSDS